MQKTIAGPRARSRLQTRLSIRLYPHLVWTSDVSGQSVEGVEHSEAFEKIQGNGWGWELSWGFFEETWPDAKLVKESTILRHRLTQAILSFAATRQELIKPEYMTFIDGDYHQGSFFLGTLMAARCMTLSRKGQGSMV